MNKAITDGVLLMPPVFGNGLDVWSSGDGTPGSNTYENAANAVFVQADQDFGGCLELQKTDDVQKLRFTGDTPILPGCYLRVRARVKAISGNLPTVRIAGWAGGAGGTHVAGVTESGPAKALTNYGEVVEVTAIVGTGQRTGVDMVWGAAAIFGHFGIDITGANGGVVRIDDIEITDVTSVFLRDMLNIVDVRDYGAIGDGVTDDSAAFAAADADAGGRRIFVSAGAYRLDSSVTLNAPVIFEGTVSMPDDQMLLLTRSFDLPTYIDAFGNEELAFRKAFQALLNNADHESLDLGGRKVSVTGPIDMQAAVPNKASYATRRVIRNGQFDAAPGAAWDTQVVTSVASYAASNAKTLTNVQNVANIPVGALVEGNGVGREIYVKAKNVAAQEITLNAALHDAEGTQSFTFRKFQHMLDFSGFSKLSKFALDDIEIQCNDLCSGINLAPSGTAFQMRDCFVSRPMDRGITSTGGGCQGMLIDRCQFLSSEDALPVDQRVSIAVNANANDVKLRNNRATKFRHFAVLGGANNVVLGNHFFQGDDVSGGVRSAGLVLAEPHASSVVSGNYVDNCYIEWTNERDAVPAFTTGYSFSALTVSDNVFLAGDVAPWFSYVVVKPFGAGHFLNGVNVTGNRFRAINGTIDRAERVDASIADLDYDRFKHVEFDGNSFHAVDRQVQNPLRVRHTESTAATVWTIDTVSELPFQAFARNVDGIVMLGEMKDAGGTLVHVVPHAKTREGANKDQVQLVWPQAVAGEVSIQIRVDN